MEKFKCWDCSEEVFFDNMKDEKIIERIKKVNLKSTDGYYLLICSKCGMEDE